MIRNIVFDMGGVLIRFDQKYFIERLGYTGTAEEILMREVFHSIEWAMMDRGIITDEEAVERISSRVQEPLHDAVNKLITMWDRPILPVEGLAEVIRKLKTSGYHIYLLSNASFHQHEYWNRIPGSEYFDDTLISCDVKVIKPQPEIYQMCFTKFNILPEESIFIDDSPWNAEAAVQEGMDAVVFHGDVNILINSLKDKGVHI